MLGQLQKDQLSERLKRIGGQITGIAKMIDDDRYCMDILNQTAAVVAALRKVEETVLGNHLNTCVVDAIRSEDIEEQRRKTSEVMDLIASYKKSG